MILRLNPKLVKGHQHTPEIAFGNPFLPAQRAWTMTDRSELGHVGNPAVATPEKGEQLLAVFADGFQDFMKRVIAWDGKAWEG